MPLLLSALITLVLLAVPSAGVGQTPRTNAPPGNSAIDEYLETVPGATGNQRPRPPADGTASETAALTPAQRARLERAGPDGKTLANVIDATTARAAPHKGKPVPATTQGRSPVREVVGAATGQSGGGAMGLVLPAILFASLLGTAAIVMMRRRSVS